ncbi:uncharacterized protein LOC143131845 [Alosa pseudoharengus]|uniref:uncharacterized protein LOC143131845 n=1 Tax=Alosa pseudoharengus TaxID=34774 RepID=UPI003F8B5D77
MAEQPDQYELEYLRFLQIRSTSPDSGLSGDNYSPASPSPSFYPEDPDVVQRGRPNSPTLSLYQDSDAELYRPTTPHESGGEEPGDREVPRAERGPRTIPVRGVPRPERGVPRPERGAPRGVPPNSPASPRAAWGAIQETLSLMNETVLYALSFRTHAELQRLTYGVWNTIRLSVRDPHVYFELCSALNHLHQYFDYFVENQIRDIMQVSRDCIGDYMEGARGAAAVRRFDLI